MGGAAIITIFKGIPVIRGFFGDILIVMFIYSAIKAVFTSIIPEKLVFSVFLFSCFIETLQYFNVPQYFDAKNLVIILTLGSTFDPMDIVAYGAGSLFIYCLDRFYITQRTGAHVQ